MIDSIFFNISVILGMTIFFGFLAQILRQPLIIAYIITGILSGPVFFNLINKEQEYFHIFAEFGVILLLFLVGLGLNFSFLKKMGKVATVTGVGQVIFTSLFGFLILIGLGFEREFAMYLAIAMTFSSTIIIMKLLSEKREAETVYGRYTIGLMLVQDIIAIILLILLPLSNSGESLFISVMMLLAKSVLFLLCIYFISKFVLRLLDRAAQSGEFLLIFTIGWCFTVAALADMVGLSLEVGAIVAGLSLGSSVYQSEISSRIRPLRDFFIVLFFIILGSEMDLSNIGEVVLPGVILSSFVLLGNPLILYILYRTMKFTRRISFKAGLTAAQVSEFGFIFLFIVEQQGYVQGDMMPLFTFVALATIFVSSYLIMYNSQIYLLVEPLFRKFGKDKYTIKENKENVYDVLVFGYHRLGWKICDTLSGLGISYAVVDFDPLALSKLEARGIPHFFGDASDVEFLSELPLSKTKLIISTLGRASVQMTMIKNVRDNHKKPVIIAHLSYTRFIDDLYEVGADYVILPHLVASEWLSNLIEKKQYNRRTIKRLCREQKDRLQLKHTLPQKNDQYDNIINNQIK